MHYSSILPDVLKIADAASEKVLSIYMTDFKVDFKADESPITAADVASHRVIVAGLRHLSHDIPVLSEEGAEIPWSERKQWRRFWLIDPIDGTKDFTQRTGEFTVNIALIENGEPILGVVTAPALKEAYWGLKGEGAYKRDRTGRTRRISVVEPGEAKRVVASKNHLNEETKAFINKLGAHELVQAGSSLKFCKIAEGMRTFTRGWGQLASGIPVQPTLCSRPLEVRWKRWKASLCSTARKMCSTLISLPLATGTNDLVRPATQAQSGRPCPDSFAKSGHRLLLPENHGGKNQGRQAHQKAGTPVPRLPVREPGANGPHVGQATLHARNPADCQLR